MSQEGEREGALEAQDPAAAQRTVERKEKSWKKHGQGRGNRWLMLRDLLAILSIRPSSTTLIQDIMFLHKGLKRSTIREMLDQLERTRSIEQVQDASGPIKQWVWIATEGGVQFWIGSRKDIPATIAQVAWTLKSVSIFEEEDPR